MYVGQINEDRRSGKESVQIAEQLSNSFEQLVMVNGENENNLEINSTDQFL